MEVDHTEDIKIVDPTSVGQARRAALLVAERLGMDATKSGELALLTTEVARNVLLHGEGGQIIVAGLKDGEQRLARLLALDKGPGIPNMGKAMSDGYSTAGTMGAGMGAMKRMADRFDIFTGKTGTIVLIEVGSMEQAPLQTAGFAVPYPGERACGDAWAVHESKGRLVAMLADGLGHGRDAAEAASEAVATFHRRADSAPSAILGYLHDALRKTRGAVAAVAEIRPAEGKLTFSGVGNIAGVILSDSTSRSMVSHNGTLGLATSRVQEFHFDWTPDSTMILHSDGLHSRWDLSTYPGLLSRHPALIAGALLRDQRRQRDDASVVVVKAAA